jgi:two-component system, OmpR family, sensor histidine kinase SenX3
MVARTIEDVDATLAATLGGLAGLAVGAIAAFAFRFSERTQRQVPEHPEPVVPPDVAKVLGVLRSTAIVVGPHDEVMQASAPARAYGLVRGARVVIPELLDMVRQVRRDGEIRQCDLDIPRDQIGREQLSVAARVAPIGSRLILVLVEDRTKERRLDAIRRDFVANVSHELKTPIGAMVLLAEAVQHAADEPEAVQRFSMRMQIEGERLSRLVQQIIELSRVQADDLVDEASPVSLGDVVEAALDRSRVDAQNKQIELVRAGDTDVTITGSEQQLLIALGNLVENAVAYSSEHTRVVVDLRRRYEQFAGGQDEYVEIAVSDQGVGIPEQELERVFERFYRIDQARSRDTGGTGLGLSIVKHVAASHGGTVEVWSVEGEGSTFTLRLPFRSEQPTFLDGVTDVPAAGQAAAAVLPRQKEATR